MQLIIHRGTQEIGGSCVELIANNSSIIIDLGIPLISAKKDRPFDPGILKGESIKALKEFGVLPDIKGLYRGDSKRINAIFISHSHLDHYGLLQYVHPEIPIYMSEGAEELIKISDIFTPNKTGSLNIKILPKAKRMKIGDFGITAYLVDHSAFDALAFLIEGGGKRLFYSGDFRGHGRKKDLFKKVISKPQKNIDCLLMEGAMLGRTRQVYKNEVSVQKGMEEVLRSQDNISFFFTSSQNIDRIVSAYKACRRTNSIFVIDIYTAFILHRLGKYIKSIPQFNWKNIRVKFFKYHADRLAEKGDRKLLYLFNSRKIEMDEIDAKKDKILMLLRDNSLFPKVIDHIHGIKGATIIYSMWEGYLTDVFKRYCAQKGISIKQIHTSGHAVVEDLKAFAEAMNPKMLIPIHTFEARKYPSFFKNTRALQDGEVLAL